MKTLTQHIVESINEKLLINKDFQHIDVLEPNGTWTCIENVGKTYRKYESLDYDLFDVALDVIKNNKIKEDELIKISNNKEPFAIVYESSQPGGNYDNTTMNIFMYYNDKSIKCSIIKYVDKKDNNTFRKTVIEFENITWPRFYKNQTALSIRRLLKKDLYSFKNALEDFRKILDYVIDTADVVLT